MSQDVKQSVSLKRSAERHQRARKTLAGGVATAIRAGQLPWPITFDHGSGAHLVDIDGNHYVDYVAAYGPLVLGHSPRRVLDAVRLQLDAGIGFGASHRWEAEAAEAVCRTVPCAELSVFSNTGSEAVQVALRIARAATGRPRVIKFLGHYHGWYDAIHVGVHGQSTAAPGTAGQVPVAPESLTVLPWNDAAALADALADDVAAVIMEPVAVNGGCLLPRPGYLEEAQRLAHAAGAVLIFDEVITGFRVALGGAQARLGVIPDLTVLGKALGAGFPISCVCGRESLMEVVASGRVAHVGTFNANPVSACAAVAAIRELEEHGEEIYPELDRMGVALAESFREETAAVGLPIVVNQFGAAAHAFFKDGPVDSYDDMLGADPAAYREFAGALLERGIHVTPKGLLYVSTEHGDDDLALTRAAVGDAARAMAQEVRAAG
jgi:glutamate-1-semialdehyde 2,1-aminomutase